MKLAYKQQTFNTVNQKGNWEASFFQRGNAKSQLNEQYVKAECPTGSLDPFKIYELMNPK